MAGEPRRPGRDQAGAGAAAQRPAQALLARRPRHGHHRRQRARPAVPGGGAGCGGDVRPLRPRQRPVRPPRLRRARGHGSGDPVQDRPLQRRPERRLARPGRPERDHARAHHHARERVVTRAAVANAPRPFRQGDLDGLCGAYAVVNAVRLAALPYRRLRHPACAALFAELVDELAEAGRLRAFVTGGMGADRVARLLRRAKVWLDVEFGLRLKVSRPFRKDDEPGPEACLQLLAGHLGRGGTAAIVGTETHWTVVSAVRGGRLVLADSHDRRYFVAAKALGDDVTANRLHLSSTFLLRVTKPP